MSSRLHVRDRVPGVPRQTVAPGEPGGEGEWHVDRRFYRAARVARAGSALKIKLSEREAKIAWRIVREIVERLRFLDAVGLVTSRLRGRPRRYLVGKDSAFGWLLRLVPSFVASCMSR